MVLNQSAVVIRQGQEVSQGPCKRYCLGGDNEIVALVGRDQKDACEQAKCLVFGQETRDRCCSRGGYIATIASSRACWKDTHFLVLSSADRGLPAEGFICAS